MSTLAPAMEEMPTGDAIASTTVLRFVDLACEALDAAREEIDALNVYPVPDGDTGTNLTLTMAAARDAFGPVLDADPTALGPALVALARGALLGARGNSGVILSEMLGEVARRIAGAAADEPHAVVLSSALERAASAGYAAVGTPVEGTMLTVARVAAEAAAVRAGEEHARGRDVLVTAAEAAREALARTPEQLPALAAAGVVDAGGRGVCVLLDAAETAVTGRHARPRSPVPAVRCPGPAGPADDGVAPPAEDRSYEVMFLLDAEDHAVAVLRERLSAVGDSLVVVGGEGLWNVHVHVDDVGAAIEAGIEAGRPHRVRVTHFADQADQADRTDRAARRGARAGAREGRAVVAVAAGPGLAALFGGAGAVVVPGGPGRSPATGELLDAVAGSGAAEVVVLTNDADAVSAARVAAQSAERDLGVRVAVVPTATQVQGLAALAVHEPGRAFDADVLAMTATASHVRHGAVTVAARRAMTMGGPCEPGDVLGVVAGDFVVVGDEPYRVALDVLARLLAGGGELVTVVAGADAGELAARVAARVETEHPFLDVVVHDGGQDRYPLLLSVE